MVNPNANEPAVSAMANSMTHMWKQIRRIGVLMLGGLLLIAGIALLVLPGPAFVFIPAGLAILATEFVWAGRLLKRIREQGSNLGNWLRGKNQASGQKNRGPSPESQSKIGQCDLPR